jgi:hypothetical protein
MIKIRGGHICLVLLVLLFFVPVIVGAFDIGLSVDQIFGLDRFGEEKANDYQASILPWYSLLIGGTGDFFFSGALNLSYKDKEFSLVPELLRTEISWRIGGSRIKAGRIQYADPLGLIADGLFDGAQLLYDSPTIGTIGAGAWYTGLLYKERASIMLSPEDIDHYYALYNINDFTNTYFAPKRLMFAANWEHPALAERFQLKAGIVGQIDINPDINFPYHSQYFAAKIGVPGPGLLFELGVGFELIEYWNELNFAFAGETGLYWTLPTQIPNRLSFTGIFTGGKVDKTPVAAFTPITSKSQGAILGAKLSGISALGLDYMIRLHRTFSAGLAASYFIRSDTKTFQSYPVADINTMVNQYLLGGEFYAKLIWSPLSDLRLTMGGGVFMPSLGDIAPKAGNKWRIELSAAVALF